MRRKKKYSLTKKKVQVHSHALFGIWLLEVNTEKSLSSQAICIESRKNEKDRDICVHIGEPVAVNCRHNVWCERKMCKMNKKSRLLRQTTKLCGYTLYVCVCVLMCDCINAKLTFDHLQYASKS